MFFKNILYKHNKNKDINLNQKIIIEGNISSIEILSENYILPKFNVIVVDGEKRVKLSLSNIDVKYD